MKKAELVSVIYEPSDDAKVQGTWKNVEPYIKRGFYEKENRNGFHILQKPVRVIVRLKNDTESQSFNMKNDIRDFYGRKQISEKLCGQFNADAKAGKINFFLEDGEYAFCKAQKVKAKKAKTKKSKTKES